MRREDVPPALLSDVKNHLNITWEDEATDGKVRGLIASATVYLDGKAGVPQAYETDGMARTLLFECVRYARDEALDVFETNYLHWILALQTERRLKAYAQSATSETG